MAGPLAGGRTASDHNQPKLSKVLRARYVPVSIGRGAPRRPPRGLHRHRHRRALQADARLQRAPSDGLGRLRPARRATTRSRPARIRAITTREEHRQLPPPAQGARLLLRLGARGRHDRPRLLQVDAVDFPAALSRRASPTCRIAPVNWCPALGTVPGQRGGHPTAACERGDTPVERQPLRQWMLRITAYADRLLEDLDELDWPESTLEMQRNWIGRSEGAEVVVLSRSTGSRAGDEDRASSPRAPTRSSARPTWCSRPSIRSSSKLTDADAAADGRRRTSRGVANKSDLERTDLAKEKTGVFTGAYAVNPVNGERNPDLDRRLRPVGLRHRRDHGGAGARRARPRVRA